MQAVGKIGSYVSGPFHPFGGAVDIIVVEQPDGTYKSSPWYVRFGKFQGVLKTKEKVVNISVNGVEADFHMYLDHKGEAYFLKEVDTEEGEDPCSPSHLLDDSTKSERNRISGIPRSNSRRAQILGLVFGRKSMKEEVTADRENSRVYDRKSSLECAEIAADLLDLKWSTNLPSSRRKGDNSSPELENTLKENGVDVKCLSSDYKVTAVSIESVGERTDLSHSETAFSDNLGLAKSNFRVSSAIEVSEVPKSDSEIQMSVENAGGLDQIANSSETLESSRVTLKQSIQQKNGSFCHGGCKETCVHTATVQNINMKFEPGGDVVHALEALNVNECLKNGEEFSLLREGMISMAGGTLSSASESNVPENCSQSISVHQSNGSFGPGDASSVATAATSSYSTYSLVPQPTVLSGIQASGISQQECLLLDNLDGVTKYKKFNCTDHEGKRTSPSFSSTIIEGVNEDIGAGHCSVFSLEQSIIDDYIGNTNSPKRRTRSTSNDISIDKTGNIQSKEHVRTVKSVPSVASLCNNFEASDLDYSSSHSSFIDAMASTYISHQSRVSQTMAECREGTANSSLGKCPSTGDSFGRTRRGWPFSFKRSRSISVSHFENNGIANSSEVVVLNKSNGLEGGKDSPKIKLKKILRTRTPTSEQVASLNLKEGKNTVAFTFFTSMLREQQVDARIFLWRWDARIVISDVDGTITRSDLLGQVMPLVGMDWSQTGVAHLFSAIKENGYQLIFLSARSISQSFRTRQFLCNIRQDGKALPDGPVVISPDGLFPSLFREVIRRTPHEFKISCLEDIRALFPLDRNPFYAGFGNRDTDEFSYLKVGIPRGKIFTINPKGEIVVNHHVHTKSYLSLHALVHGMFPSMSSSEQIGYLCSGTPDDTTMLFSSAGVVGVPFQGRPFWAGIPMTSTHVQGQLGRNCIVSRVRVHNADFGKKMFYFSLEGKAGELDNWLRVPRAPLKRARVDEAGTSCPSAEEAISPVPVSGPLQTAPLSSDDPALEVAEPDEAAPALPLPGAEPVMVSSSSQGFRASDRPLSGSGDPEVRGLPSASSGSLRRGESPSSHVRGTAKMVKACMIWCSKLIDDMAHICYEIRTSKWV